MQSEPRKKLTNLLTEIRIPNVTDIVKKQLPLLGLTKMLQNAIAMKFYIFYYNGRTGRSVAAPLTMDDLFQNFIHFSLYEFDLPIQDTPDNQKELLTKADTKKVDFQI